MNICRSKDGFIKLHYKIQDSDLWEDNNALVVFLRMIGYAHYEDDFTSIRFNGQQRHLKRGEFSASVSELARMVNLPVGTLRDVLARLEADKRISKQTSNRTTIFRICNYAKYQDAPTKTPASSATTKPTNSPASPTEGKKNIKKRKNIYSENELLELLNEKTNRTFRTLPRGYKETISKFSLEEIGQALDNMKKDVWHAPRLGELKSDYLLRSSTIDNMLSLTVKENKANGNDWFDSQPLDIY